MKSASKISCRDEKGGAHKQSALTASALKTLLFSGMVARLHRDGDEVRVPAALSTDYFVVTSQDKGRLGPPSLWHRRSELEPGPP